MTLKRRLKDVSFNLNPGERVGLIGPNGCGKTTLMRILVGQESADTGHSLSKLCASSTERCW